MREKYPNSLKHCRFKYGTWRLFSRFNNFFDLTTSPDFKWILDRNKFCSDISRHFEKCWSTVVSVQRDRTKPRMQSKRK